MKLLYIHCVLFGVKWDPKRVISSYYAHLLFLLQNDTSVNKKYSRNLEFLMKKKTWKPWFIIFVKKPLSWLFNFFLQKQGFKNSWIPGLSFETDPNFENSFPEKRKYRCINFANCTLKKTSYLCILTFCVIQRLTKSIQTSLKS